MSAGLLFDLGLCLLLLGVALAAVTGRETFTAIVFFIAYGLLIAIAWVRLDSVNVALAEAAIGAGLTGVLLLGTWARVREAGQGAAEPSVPEPSLAERSLVAALCLGLTVGLASAVRALPGEAPGLAPLVADNLAAAGVENAVTAVLLNFRAYDTLLESIVIAVALVAVWALTPAGCWGGVPGLRQHVRPDGVLATFGRLLPPSGLVVAVYLVWAGTSLPGGAFQAGTILAAVLLLAAMAGLLRPPPVTAPAVRLGLIAGPLVFLGIGLAGAFFGSLLGLPENWAGALIVAIEVVLTASIAVALAYMVLGVPRTGQAGP